MNNQRRDEAMYKAWKNGDSLTKLSKLYGVSDSRAWQICQKQKRKEERRNSDNQFEATIEKLDNSVRIYNCLMRAGINTLEKLKSYSPDELIKVRNLGDKCLNTLIEAGLCNTEEEEDDKSKYLRATFVSTDSGLITLEEYMKESTGPLHYIPYVGHSNVCKPTTTSKLPSKNREKQRITE